MSGNRPETVRKPSAYRTTSGRFPDIAVWVSTRSPVPLVPLHTHPPTPPPAKRASLRQLRGEVQCPETVRKPSGRWTVCGRFPDIEVRKSSAWWTQCGRFADLVYEVTRFVTE